MLPGLLVLAVVAGCGGKEASPAETRSLPTEQPVAAAAAHAHDPIPSARVTVEDAAEILEARGAVFIDVRAVAAYEASRIPGAVSIPLETLTRPLQGVNLNTPIITYCT